MSVASERKHCCTLIEVFVYIIYIIQVKKKVFTINANIEDVGLNEDLKTRNGH